MAKCPKLLVSVYYEVPRTRQVRITKDSRTIRVKGDSMLGKRQLLQMDHHSIETRVQMKSFYVLILFTLSCHAKAQGFPDLPVKGENVLIRYQDETLNAIMFHGNQETYGMAIDFALKGEILRTELYKEWVYSYIRVDDSCFAVWFLHEYDPKKTDLFFFIENQVIAP